MPALGPFRSGFLEMVFEHPTRSYIHVHISLCAAVFEVDAPG